MTSFTVLFENLIQGVQTFAWLALLVMAVLGQGFVVPSIVRCYSTEASFVAVVAFYWLGILVDTSYYHWFIQRYERRWCERLLGPEEPTLAKMVFACLAGSAEIGRLLLERQAHLRLLRVSVVNSAFLTISGLLFCIFGVHVRSLAAYVLIGGGGAWLFLVSIFAWRKLYAYYVSIAKSGYFAIRAQADGTSVIARPE